MFCNRYILNSLPAAPAGPAGARLRGVTLVEMIVGMVLLVMIIGVTTKAMSESKKVANILTANIKANTAAEPIARMIREDIKSITKKGFLGIRNRWVSYFDEDDVEHLVISGSLVFTAVGSYRSATSEYQHGANAAIIYYGHDKRAEEALLGDDKTIGPQEMTLLRRLTLLTPGKDPNSLEMYLDKEQLDNGLNLDYLDLSLADLGLMTYPTEITDGSIETQRVITDDPDTNLRDWMHYVTHNYNGFTWDNKFLPTVPVDPNDEYDGFPRTIYRQPSTFVEIKNNWPYLAGECTEFIVEWTYGNTEPDPDDLNDPPRENLIWFGGWEESDNPSISSKWRLHLAEPDVVEPLAEVPYEYQIMGVDEGTLVGRNKGLAVGDEPWPEPLAMSWMYIANFTHHDPDRWPKALRITYTLGVGDNARRYQVIVDLND